MTARLLAIATLAASVAGPRMQAVVPRTAALSGVVVDGLTGQPLSDAVVAVSILTTAATEVGGLPERQQTDARGRFVFPTLSGNETYVVTATRRGYLASADVPPSLAQATNRVPLAAGTWAREVRVALYPPASISGAVADGHGDPLVGLWVRVWQQFRIGDRNHLASGPATTTDDLGHYRISGLIRGSYVVSVLTVSESDATGPMLGRFNAESQSGFAFSSQYHPSARDASSATPIAVEYGQERGGVDFTLTPDPAHRVSGVVHAPSTAMSSLQLWLTRTGSEGLGLGSETATTRPGSDGAFLFPDVPAGSYALVAAGGHGEFVATADPYTIVRMRLPSFKALNMTSVDAASEPVMFGQTLDSEGSVFGQRPVTVADADVTGLNLDVAAGASISGQLVLEAGSETPANGTASIIVEPSPENAWLMTAGLRTADRAETAASWTASRRFEIAGLLPGRYFIRARGGAIIKSIEWNGRELANQPVDVDEGATLNGVTITVTTRTATIAGSVRRDSGQTRASPIVVCFPANREAWRAFGLSPVTIRSGPVAHDGTFRIGGLPAGDYYVLAVPAEQQEAWRDLPFLEAASRLAERVRLEWGVTTQQALDVKTVSVR